MASAWIVLNFSSVQFSRSVVSDSVTPWIAAHQASLSITNSQSSLKFMSIESVMPSSHLILCRSPSPPAFNLSQRQGFFKWVSSLHQVAKVLEFQLQHQSFQRTPRAYLLAKGLSRVFQYHSSKASVLRRSAFFTVQLSHPHMTKGNPIAMTRRTFVDKVMSLLLNILSGWS